MLCPRPLNLSFHSHLGCFCYETFFHILTYPSSILLSSGMIFHRVYLPHSMNTRSPRVGHLGCEYRQEQSDAGHRDTGWDADRLSLWVRGRGNKHVGGEGEPGLQELQPQSCLISPAELVSLRLFIHQSHTPQLWSQNVSRCFLPPLSFLLFFTCYAN